ncbi:hypothetical protein B0H17DRAFT_1132907 [Mycena rosella]|uniref:DUF6593 domain-containing protein n=1 Tax=Mycena rosella TaxID=1033263 RepID=A0AAD7GFW0_MYCRO|nr:hypothetical protein B0H17DRAFT_1132907 [Mycena rosella]
MFNPYAQGGWRNAGNPSSTPSRGTLPQPSIFGALPYPTLPAGAPPAAASTFISFRFSSFSPTILDSVVTGPKSRTYFRVKTDSPTVGFTAIHNSASQPVIIIEWLKHPVIEIRDILSKRQTSQWLPISADRSHRTMTANGKTFVWASEGQYICLQLFSAGVGAPQPHARVLREETAIVLEITAEAVQIGLLELCIAATLLLHSRRNID